MILLEFSMTPLGKGESVSAYVAPVLDIVDRSGLPYRLTPMGTIVEGEWDAVLAVVRQCYERLRVDCPRILCTMKIDAPEPSAGRLESKIASVERRLGRALHK